MSEVLKNCFSVNLDEYENINFSLEINKVILGAFIALIVGVIFLHVYRGTLRLIVMQLIRHSARDVESAKTLEELGLDKNRIVKRLLSSDNQTRRIVSGISEKSYSYEEYKELTKEEKEEIEKTDFESERFYIREEQSNRAAFVADRYVSSVMRTAAVCVFIGVICFCTIVCMPGILNVVDSILGKLKT